MKSHLFRESDAQHQCLRLGAALAVVLAFCHAAPGERIKDIVDIQGVRGNPLNGIGLVTGLAGTGDTTLLSRQMLTNILRDSGLVLTPNDLTGGNIAVVMVSPICFSRISSPMSSLRRGLSNLSVKQV